jgi:hypothetical protein
MSTSFFAFRPAAGSAGTVEGGNRLWYNEEGKSVEEGFFAIFEKLTCGFARGHTAMFHYL